jgi:DNA invertase Pin-like site-specific DNA recombinase
MTTACAYFRTSSATNVGDDKDSLKRQQDAVRAYAAANGLEIVREYYDAAVKGTDAVQDRAGFAEMFAYMMGNGARIVLVESASRFARDHVVQAMGFELLKKQGVSLIPVDAPTHFTEDSPTATMLRTIISAVSQFEKEALVLKLRKARDRKRATTGRCEGRKPVPLEVVTAARAARARGLSLRQVGAELQTLGFKTYGAQSIKLMISIG